MKKVILFSLLFVSMYLVNAQDTLYYKNGSSKGVKITSIGKKNVTYFYANDEEFKPQTVKKDSLKKAKLTNGNFYWFNDNLPRTYIVFKIGNTNPIGYFASREFNKKVIPGFALQGRQVSIESGIYIKKNWGIVLNLSVGGNPFDSISFKSQLGVNSSFRPNKDFQKQWDNFNLGIGILKSFNISNKSFIDLKVASGMHRVEKWGNSSYEFQDTQYDYSTNQSNIVVSRLYYSKGNGIGSFFRVDLNYKYQFSKRFAFFAGAEALRGRAIVDYSVRFFDGFINSEKSEPVTSKFITAWIHPYIGLAVTFNRHSK